ncbi:tyrosine-protein phosphatase 10D-like isoform X2 [Tubulanus polymorphus]|uniref:tyrosine-protein phosphatase 10D-like isoform X2 n=1 Tax=Tubulanus polymorphus TaxID=672921 RepID=UPI003DA664D9
MECHCKACCNKMTSHTYHVIRYNRHHIVSCVVLYMILLSSVCDCLTIDSSYPSVNSVQLSWKPVNAATSYSVSCANISAPSPTCQSNNCTGIVYGLDSGVTYNCTVTSVGAVESDSVKITTRPLPPAVRIQSRSVVSLDIAWTVDSNSVQDSVQISVADKNSAFRRLLNKSLDKNQDTAYVGNLESGDCYVVQVYSISRGQFSEPSLSLEAYTVPHPPLEATIKVESITTQSAVVSWLKPPNTTFEKYVVTVERSTGTKPVSTVDVLPNKTSADLTGLVAGYNYVVKIITVIANITSTTVSKQFVTVPSMPGMFSKSTPHLDNITVEWVKTPNEIFTNFILTINASIPNNTRVLPRETFKATFTGLSPGICYTFTLKAETSGVESAPREHRYCTKPNAPPELISSTITSNSVILSWKTPAGDYSGYRLTVSPSISQGTWPLLIPKPTTSTAVNGMIPGMVYLFKLQCVAGEFTFSDPTEVGVTTVPLPPTGFSATFTESTADISWNGPIEGKVESYDIKWVNEAIATDIGQGSSNITSYKITGLKSGYKYKIFVSSKSNGVISEPMSNFLFTKPKPPSRVFTSSKDNDTIIVEWVAPVDGSFSQYRINISPLPSRGTYPQIVASTQTNMMITSLSPATEYTFSVSTISNDIESSATELKETTNPNPVSEININDVGTTFVVISWSKPAGNIGAYSYKISWDSKSDSVTTESYNITGLIPGQQYLVQVQVISGNVFSSSVSDIVVTKPMIVENVAVKLLATNVLELKWETNKDSLQQTYEIRYRAVLENSASQYNLKKTSDKFVSFQTVTGEKYEIEIYAISRFQEIKSDAYKVSSDVIPPEMPQTLNVKEKTETSIKISWTQPSGYLTGYNLEIKENGKPIRPPSPVDKSLTLYDIQVLSGHTYFIALTSLTTGASSKPATLSVTSIPTCTVELSEKTTNETIEITYSDQPPSTNLFDSYKFELKLGKSPVNLIDNVIQPKTPPNGTISFNKDIVSGQKYQVSVVTISKTEISSPKTLPVVAKPNVVKPESVAQTNRINFTWARPTGVVEAYRLYCVNQADCGNKAFIETTRTSLSLTSLQPHKIYNFFFVSVSHATESRSIPIIVETGQSAPGPVRDIQISDLKPYELKLIWTPPHRNNINGVLKKYIIEYITSYQSKNVSYVNRTEVAHFGNSEHKQMAVINELRGGYTYYFTIKAETGGGIGPGNSISQLTPVEPPAFKVPINSSQPKASQKILNNSTMISASFINPFSEKNGAILYYSVIVAEKSSDLTGKVKFYDEIKDLAVWTPYASIYQCDIFMYPKECQNNGVQRSKRHVIQKRSANAVDILLGVQQCQNPGQPCNGPLKPNTDFRVKLRAYTIDGQFTDTPYSQPIKTAVEPFDTKGIIIGVVIAVVVLVIVVIVIGVIIYRRYINGPKPHPPDLPPRPDEEIPIIVNSRPVKLTEFEEHFKYMSADTDFRFAEEYEELSLIGRELTTENSQHQCNRMKNRFTNILPYDWSRVKLCPMEDEDGQISDYINANYMPGYTSKREFIVSQGPLPSTIDDFWRMIWEQNSRAIVMVTQLIENGRVRCEQYWPRHSDPVYYGDVEVTILTETRYKDFSVMELMLKKDGYKRYLTHFYYRVWPDHGVPLETSSLLAFIRYIRAKLQPGGPITVHCSAGVGRSGTYIALDRAIQHIEHHDSIDVYGIVYEMRKSRKYMVQTEQQYVFIHLCILDVLKGKENQGSPELAGQENGGYEGQKVVPDILIER